MLSRPVSLILDRFPRSCRPDRCQNERRRPACCHPAGCQDTGEQAPVHALARPAWCETHVSAYDSLSYVHKTHAYYNYPQPCHCFHCAECLGTCSRQCIRCTKLLPEARSGRCNLRDTNPRSANLSNADLTGASIVSAELRGADLPLANLSSADLHKAIVFNADLRSTNLTRADLTDVVRHAGISRADLENVDAGYDMLGPVKGLDTVKGLVC